jgi:hypothetical protein
MVAHGKHEDKSEIQAMMRVYEIPERKDVTVNMSAM